MKALIVVLVSSIFSIGAYGFTLEPGALCGRGTPPKSELEQNAAKIISGLIRAQGKSVNGCVGWESIGDPSLWYFVDKEFTVHEIDISKEAIINSWPLTRWQHEPLTNQQSPYYPAPENVSLDWIDGHVDDRYGLELDDEKKPNSIGCLNQTPLRYGDLEGDGTNEIVLNMGVFSYKHDWVIFSPKYESISFSLRYALQDQANVDFGSYQWIQETRQRNTDPGIRTYAKAFLGDFDLDENPGILVWRKRYESNKNDNPVLGYHLVKQEIQHYERDLEAQASLEQGVTGEYLPQDTTEEQIQAWLTGNNHTWQSGYPSLSECDGEEDQLIPEMHDPLLNDPDVLR